MGREATHSTAVNYFHRLLSTEAHSLNFELINLIPHDVSTEDNENLIAPFSVEDVKSALSFTPLDVAPGSDGFSAAFFPHSWDIIKDDVVSAMNEMLSSATVPDCFSHTAIVLIPKHRVVESLGDFRPIGLCSMVYKIFAKLMCDRLATILLKHVSLNQGAFVRGHSIFDNISLTHEICREIRKPGSSPNVVLALDMHKAYDRLEWDFLFAVLQRCGFSNQWLAVIGASIKGCKFSVILNGKLDGFFEATRGLRQGDPLSRAFLFLPWMCCLARLTAVLLGRMSFLPLEPAALPISYSRMTSCRSLMPNDELLPR